MLFHQDYALVAQRFLLGGNLLRKDVPKGDPEMGIDAQWWRRRDSNPRPSDYDSVVPLYGEID